MGLEATMAGGWHEKVLKVPFNPNHFGFCKHPSLNLPSSPLLTHLGTDLLLERGAKMSQVLQKLIL